MLHIVLSNLTAEPISKHFKMTVHQMKRFFSKGKYVVPLKMRSSLNLATKPKETSQPIFKRTRPFHSQTHTVTHRRRQHMLQLCGLTQNYL